MKKLLLASAVAICSLTSASAFADAGLAVLPLKVLSTPVTFIGQVSLGTVTWVVKQKTGSNNTVNLQPIDFTKSITSTTDFTLSPEAGQSTTIDTELQKLDQHPKITWSAFTTTSAQNMPKVKLTLINKITGKPIKPNVITTATSYEVDAKALSAVPGTYIQKAIFTVSYK